MSVTDDMYAAHPFIGPLMVEALSCISNAIDLFPNPALHRCFRVGTEVIHDIGISEDLCCEGLAYAMLGEVYPSAESFPEHDIIRQANSSCVPPTWGVQIRIGIVRCIPVGGVDPLPCDDWGAAAVQNVYDARALLVASCCIRDFVVNSNGSLLGMSAVIDRQTQGNVLGGCIERYVGLSLQIPDCEC